MKAILLHLGGRVQGVGFRPFVYRLAHEYKLCGWIRNLSGEVAIFLQGPEEDIQSFTRALVERAPPLAKPEILSMAPAAPASLEGFSIRESQEQQGNVHVPPDQFTCEDCLRELTDPRDRRYRYPFINCTQCGPRYTLIQKLPYDRPHTTMAGFPLCSDCQREYQDPMDRRFHAQPLACPTCGPRLSYGGLEGHEALAACIRDLRAGKVVAVKGVGGFHLMCDARNDAAIAHLRKQKPRPHKPLAVMLPP
ncbi:MAG: carbamoyltransferase HypF, partial [Gammaproteobacteria bacterium]